MISSISSATAGLQAAFARFDRTAAAVVDSSDAIAADDAGDPSALGSAIVAMMSARFEVRAALEVARTSNDMLAESITLGGYGD